MAFDETTIMAGKNCRLFVNQFDISGWTNSYGATDDCKDLDCSCFGPAEQSKPGQARFEMNFAGLYPNAAGIGSMRDAILAACYSGRVALETAKVIFLPGAVTAGSLAFHGMGSIRAGGVKAAGGDLVRMTAKIKPTGFADLNAHLLGLVTLTAASAGTTNGTTVDAGLARVGAIGSAAHLAAFSWGGGTSLAVKVQHSSNGSSWSDLITFTTATGVTSERKTTTGDVYRYRRVAYTTVGTVTAAFVVTFGEAPATA